jgi:outer membrane protein OmpA-like peptidoglycan-associated protein
MRPIVFPLLIGLLGGSIATGQAEAQFTKRVLERIKQKAAEKKQQTEENAVNRAAEPADSAMAKVAAPVESLTARVGGKAGEAVGRLGRGKGGPSEEQALLRQELATGKAELAGVRFVPGAEALDPSSEQSLRSLATVMTDSPGVFLIQGRADPGTTATDAAPLATARAAAIKAWLIGNGIPVERVFSAGDGVANPQGSLVTVALVQ